jgi:hypothetical protein
MKCVQKWKIPRIWNNETVFIFGGGPTLPGTIKGYSFVDHNVLGVNSAFLLNDVDVLYFGDAKFYWWNREAIQKFTGLKITSNQGVHHGHRSVEGEFGIKLVGIGKYKGLESRHDRIAWNRSSGAAAINVAIHLGAKQIVLLGFDMRRVDGQKNWLSHKEEITNQNPYDYMLEGFRQIARVLGPTGVQIINATPKSKIRFFQRMKLEDVF